jgi:hypothetical protein
MKHKFNDTTLIFVLIILLFVFQCADLVTTFMALEYVDGVVEANPFMRYFVEQSIWAFALAKIISIIVIVWSLIYGVNKYDLMPDCTLKNVCFGVFLAVLIFTNAIMAHVVANNFQVIFLR